MRIYTCKDKERNYNNGTINKINIIRRGGVFCYMGKLQVTEEQALELIKRRRFQIALHSTIYYVYDTNIISDSEYDRFSRELVELQERFPQLSRLAPLYEAFKDWDGSTGFHLTQRLNFHHKALYMIRLHENRRN